MDFNLKYYYHSLKVIPLPSEKLYKTILIEKVELVIKKIKWKAHLYENSVLNTLNHLNFFLKVGNVRRNIKILCNLKTTYLN